MTPIRSGGIVLLSGGGPSGFNLWGSRMNRAQKSLLMGGAVAVAVMVFVPSVYVTIANKLGKLAEVRDAATGAVV